MADIFNPDVPAEGNLANQVIGIAQLLHYSDFPEEQVFNTIEQLFLTTSTLLEESHGTKTLIANFLLKEVIPEDFIYNLNDSAFRNRVTINLRKSKEIITIFVDKCIHSMKSDIQRWEESSVDSQGRKERFENLIETLEIAKIRIDIFLKGEFSNTIPTT